MSCALRFAPPVDDLIRELKYHGVIANARVLGVLLAQAVQERGGAAAAACSCPVPLHVARLRERGFNQAAALARYAGRMLDIPVRAQRRAPRARHAVANVARAWPSGIATCAARSPSTAARSAAQVVSGAATWPSSTTS